MTAKKPAKTYPPESEWVSGSMVADGVQYRGPKQFRASIWSVKPPLQESFETLEAAVSWRDATLKKVKGEGPEAFVDTRLPAKTTLAEACKWALDRMGPKETWKHANDKNLVSKWKWWMNQSPYKLWTLDKITDFVLFKWVEKITAVDVGDDEEDMADAMQEIFELEGSYAIVTNQTIVHRLNALSRVYQDWRRANELTERQCPNPVIRGVRPPIDGKRNRRLEEGEYAQLLAIAAKSRRSWLPDAIVLAVETGMRQTELAKLTWFRTHLDDAHPYIHLNKTKNGNERDVPLSNPAIKSLENLKRLADEHNARRQQRIDSATTDKAREKAQATPIWTDPLPVETGRGIIHAFREAINAARMEAREAGDPNWLFILEDLRWHDLRHEAVSRLFENNPGFRDIDIQNIVGHLSPEMTKRYAALRTKFLGQQLREGENADLPGSVKITQGKPVQVKMPTGKWVEVSKVDAFSREHAKRMLLDVLERWDADLQAADGNR